MAKSKGSTKSKSDEVEDLEVDEDVELDELDEDVEGESNGKGGGQEVTFGVSDLAKYLSKETGKTIKPRDLRTLIRKMARDGSGRVNREITPGNRSRYDWPDGLKDPEVKRIVKAVKAGELEQGKKEALEKLKARKAEGKGKGKKNKKGKKAKAEEPEDDDVEEVDDEDLEVEDDD